MMDTTPEQPPSFAERAGLAAGLIAVAGGFLAAHLIVRSRADAVRAIGIRDLPLPTQLALSTFDGSDLWFLATLAVAPVVAVFSLMGKLGRTGWVPIVILVAAAIAIPALAFVAMEMPLVKLREHLGR